MELSREWRWASIANGREIATVEIHLRERERKKNPLGKMSIVTETQQHIDSNKSYWLEKCMEANGQQQQQQDHRPIVIDLQMQKQCL